MPVVKQYEYFDNAGLVNFQPIRLFTRNGEITSASVIAGYINEFRIHFYSAGDAFSDPSFRKFALVNADSLLNISRAPVIEARRTIIDSYDLYKSPSTTFLSDTNDIHFQLLRYKTFHPKLLSGGAEYFEWENPVYVLKKKNDSLYFPVSKYIIVSRENYITSFRSDRFNNIFNPAGTIKLAGKDTLVIQQFDLVMVKGSE